MIAADRVVLGTFSAMGSQFIVNAKIINVETGENIKADKVSANSIEEMTDKIELLAFKLAGLTISPGGAEEEIAKEFGEVFVETEPLGADIYINGVKKGKSPELFSKVPFGTIRIEARQGDLYAEKVVDITAGTGKILLQLKKVHGNLFIKSSEQNVEVYLDGKHLGPLESGFFENVPIGTFPLVLEGDGVYWEDSVEIRKGESTRIEVYPQRFGTISYSLPDDVRVEVAGDNFRRIIRGTGNEPERDTVTGTAPPLWSIQTTICTK